MAFEVRWTEPAEADFRDIFEHVSGSSPESADRFAQAILDHVAVLENFPRIGPRFQRSRRSEIREILCGPYRIFYRVLEDRQQVQILTIRHGSRRDPGPGQLFDRID